MLFYYFLSLFHLRHKVETIALSFLCSDRFINFQIEMYKIKLLNMRCDLIYPELATKRMQFKMGHQKIDNLPPFSKEALENPPH